MGYLGFIFLGLSLAAPIGPVNAAQLDKGIKNGFLQAWLVGLGAMAADAIFMLMIFFGLVHIINIPFIKTFLWCFGSLILIQTGIECVKNADSIHVGSTGTEVSSQKSFYSGFMMTLTNPLSILFWLGIYGSILAQTAEKYKTWDLLYYTSGIFIGLFLWDILMATTASVLRKYMDQWLLVTMSRIAGLSLIGFGFYFGWQAFRILFFK
jgi:L-lysine exporter family protein LysE/ArgO